MKKPIIKFKDMKEANKYLKEWQTRLFLNDWIIKIIICDEKDFKLGEGYSGENSFNFTNKSSIIRICNISLKEIEDYVAKICDEETLIHELLHCKYNWLNPAKTKYEDVIADEYDHHLLEQMANSLLMTKYNLDFDWFKNWSNKK